MLRGLKLHKPYDNVLAYMCTSTKVTHASKRLTLLFANPKNLLNNINESSDRIVSDVGLRPTWCWPIFHTYQELGVPSPGPGAIKLSPAHFWSQSHNYNNFIAPASLCYIWWFCPLWCKRFLINISLYFKDTKKCFITCQNRRQIVDNHSLRLFVYSYILYLLKVTKYGVQNALCLFSIEYFFLF